MIPVKPTPVIADIKLFFSSRMCRLHQSYAFVPTQAVPRLCSALPVITLARQPRECPSFGVGKATSSALAVVTTPIIVRFCANSCRHGTRVQKKMRAPVSGFVLTQRIVQSATTISRRLEDASKSLERSCERYTDDFSAESYVDIALTNFVGCVCRPGACMGIAIQPAMRL